MPKETQGTEFKTEGQPAFPVENTENDNSAESSTVEKETDTTQTQSQEGESNSGESQDDGVKKDADPNNLLNHPRWQEREKDWTTRFNSQEQRHVEEINKLREEITGKLGADKKEVTADDIPPWFAGDEQQWSQFLEWNKGLIKQAQDETRQSITAQSEQEQKKINEATDYFNNQIAEIENDKTLNPQGVKVDKNKLLKFVADNKLVDTEGRWHWRAGFMMMNAGVKQVNNKGIDEKKQIANATIGDRKTDSAPPAFMTSEDFKKPGARPW